MIDELDCLASEAIDPEESFMCAKLQWLVNYKVVPDCRRSLSELEVWNVRLVSSHRIGTVMWAVFDDDTRRFIVFRGYAMGTLLPLPAVAWLGKKSYRVNWLQYCAWCRARRLVMQQMQTRDLNVVLSGYSIGAAPAVYSAMHYGQTARCRVHLFSPFPFCEQRLFAALNVPFVQIWLQGDSLTKFYYPCFSLSVCSRRVIEPYRRFWTVFGYHNTQSIALSMATNRLALLKEMEGIDELCARSIHAGGSMGRSRRFLRIHSSPSTSSTIFHSPTEKLRRMSIMSDFPQPEDVAAC